MKEPTEQERKRIEQLKLQLDYLENGPFMVEYRDMAGDWTLVDQGHDPEWFKQVEYRRKPAPRFVPWTREDAAEFRGIFVRCRYSAKEEWFIDGFQFENSLVHVVEWISLESLFNEYTKLDGTPCGKEEK